MSVSSCDPFGTSGQLSQASPHTSPSVSAWEGLGIVSQLSQASPNPSLSVSSWGTLATAGQLSHTSPTPSPSASVWAGLPTSGQLSHGSPMPSVSVSGVIRVPAHAPPAWHASVPVQALLSSQGVPAGAKPLSWHRPAPVHTSWSTQPEPVSPQWVPSGASLAEQAPKPVQVSGSEHSLSEGSPQEAPADRKASTGQIGLDPSHDSATSHSPPAARQTVPALPAGWVQATPLPLHTSLVHGFASLEQEVPFGLKPSAGHVGLDPSQVPATSHTPAAFRQTVPTFPAGWVQAPLPLHTSVVHTFPSSVQPVPFDWNPSAGHEALDPVHVSAASHSPAAFRHTDPAWPAGWVQVPLPLHTSVVHALPSSVQAVPFDWNPSAGQELLDPVHVSAASHSPAGARHTDPRLPAG